MKAYKSLVKFALADNKVVSVWDGEEFQVKRSDKYQDIIDAIESVEECSLTIRDTDGVVGTALIIHDTGDDENVADFSDNDFMNRWWSQYQD